MYTYYYTLTPKLRCKEYPIVGFFNRALYLSHSNLKIAVQKIKGVHKDSLNFLIANSPETTYSAKRGLKRRG